MCCQRCLLTLTCVSALLITTHGFNGDRLASDDKLKQHEMDYGERLSSMEEPSLRDEIGRSAPRPRQAKLKGSGKERLSATLKSKVGGNQGDTPSTRCTTHQPIKLNPNDLPVSSEEAPSSPAAVTEAKTDAPPPVDNNGSGTDNDVTNNDDANTIEPTNNRSAENRILDSDDNLNQDPAKDDDYDATVSTKKYFGPKKPFFSPDHYLDDV